MYFDKILYSFRFVALQLISELNVAKGRALELEAKLEALRAELQEEGHRREAAEHVVQVGDEPRLKSHGGL